MSNYLKISKDFSPVPGARNYGDGPKSGEEFFEKCLDAKFSEALTAGKRLVIDLDGTEGYATSFFDEAFSRLALKHGAKKTWDNLEIISAAEPFWIERIKSYIFDTEAN